MYLSYQCPIFYHVHVGDMLHSASCLQIPPNDQIYNSWSEGNQKKKYL